MQAIFRRPFNPKAKKLVNESSGKAKNSVSRQINLAQ
jgi:hypothetical protein